MSGEATEPARPWLHITTLPRLRATSLCSATEGGHHSCSVVLHIALIAEHTACDIYLEVASRS